jgi:hypothetical protein
MARPQVQMITLDHEHDAEEAVAHLTGTLRDHLEHRLNVRRRLADGAQDLGRGRLLLQ